MIEAEEVEGATMVAGATGTTTIMAATMAEGATTRHRLAGCHLPPAVLGSALVCHPRRRLRSMVMVVDTTLAEVEEATNSSSLTVEMVVHITRRNLSTTMEVVAAVDTRGLGNRDTHCLRLLVAMITVMEVDGEGTMVVVVVVETGATIVVGMEMAVVDTVAEDFALLKETATHMLDGLGVLRRLPMVQSRVSVSLGLLPVPSLVRGFMEH